MAKIISIKVLGEDGTASELIPSEDGKKFDVITGGKKRTIEEITKEETEGKISLGRTGGMDMFQCFYVASKFDEDFLENLNYYRICDEEEEPFHECETIIEFYK